MKILVILFFISFFISTNTFAQKLNCDMVKTGDFIEYRGLDKVYIKRTEEFQFEFDPGAKVQIKMKVTWIDKCTYRLTYLEGNEIFEKSLEGAQPQDLIVTIIGFGEDYYEHEAVFENDPNYEKYIGKLYLAPKKEEK